MSGVRPVDATSTCNAGHQAPRGVLDRVQVQFADEDEDEDEDGAGFDGFFCPRSTLVVGDT